jgi:hypothetical protein
VADDTTQQIYVAATLSVRWRDFHEIWYW